MSDVAVCEGVPAAVAVLGEAGSVERATSGFVERFELQDGLLASFPPELEQITGGEADRLTVPLDGLEADLVAVIDREGRRTAVLTIPTTPDEGDTDRGSPLLEEPLDESPAIIWLKDLEGRYLYVNRRYLEQLGTDSDAVLGHTDIELTAARSIEGMRLEEKGTAGREPLELEYMIGAFEERPAFAALRFALRDGDGHPTAICGVAAPLPEASLARSECERLMRIDRWRRLDAFAIRQELLDEWGLTLADGSSGPPLDRDDRVAAVLVERDEALATAARLEEELAKEREQRDTLRAESEVATRRADELDGEVTAEHARAAELKQSLAEAESRVAELRGELTTVRAELEEHVEHEHELEAAVSVTPASDGLEWATTAQRAFSAALGGLTEWRAILEHAVETLGSEGGWDATVAWCRDDTRGSMRCGSIWMRDPAGLEAFQTRTWHHRKDLTSAEFGRARNRMATTCVLELRSAEDPLLRAAAEDGMGSALLVPVNDNGETIAMLELLSRVDTAPNAELMVSLEAIALQLGVVAQLLKLADVPRWRMGRR
ncbi:MAG TPA: PAS domain S-box protein [Solirubrobacteraceae bacterium]|nr:PAS domain S-box protein [Solirubrobacteraceae bacterium]